MRRLLASGLALALAVVAVVVLAKTPAAQTGSQGPGACGPDGQEIFAADIPEGAAGSCGTDGRPIVDGAAGAVLPPPGEGVHVEALTPAGAQELEMKHLPNGTIELDHVGNEAEGSGDAGAGPSKDSAKVVAPGECSDAAYQGSGYRVAEGLRYRVNVGTTPEEVSRDAAVGAIKKAGKNVARTDNECGMGDRVSAFASYQGRTSRLPDRRDGSCTRSDGVSVVAFGDLPTALAVTCTYFDLEPGPDEVDSSDVKMNKVGFRWTTRPDSRSCRMLFDVEAVMTHERGHTFGLAHVDGDMHHNLTMDPGVGPCQAAERTLGRGDVLGLDAKYP